MRTVGSDVPLPRALAHAGITVVVVVVGWFVSLVVAYLVAGPTGSVDALVVARTLLGLLLLVGLVRWRGASGLRAGLPVLPWAGVPALVAYLLVPATWVGETLAGRGVTGLPPLAVLVDLLLWAAVAGVGALWAGTTETLRERPLTPYGG